MYIYIYIFDKPVEHAYLSKGLCFGVLLKGKGREMHSRPEDLCLGQDTDTADSVDLHLHVRVAKGVSQVGQMGSPGSVLGVSLDNDGVFIECIS